MRWAGIALLVGGCNQIFDLRETIAVDAAPREFFDAPADAPFTCPPFGSAPVFSKGIRQVDAQMCHSYSYSTSADLAAAICYSTDNSSEIRTGPVDSALTTLTEIKRPAPNAFYNWARLSPEGDRLYLIATDSGAMTARLMLYARSGSTWTAMPDPAITVTYGDFAELIAVTAAPHPHLLLRQQYKLREYVSDDAGTWTALPAYADADLGQVVYSGSTTPDGLRLLLQGPLLPSLEVGVAYTDRSNVADRFRVVTPTPTLPAAINDPFLDDNCARVYFSGFGSIFSIQQL